MKGQTRKINEKDFGSQVYNSQKLSLKKFYKGNGPYKRQTYCKSCRKIYTDEYTKKTKLKVITAYGSECSCCKENTIQFLSLSHVKDDGNAHRKNINSRGGYGFYLWVIRNKFPKALEVLCHNCNMGKESNKGICPHKSKS